MAEDENKGLPANPIEAQGLLIKSFYERFGQDALPIIEKVCRLQGTALGLKMRKKVQDNRLTTVAKAFIKGYAPELINVVSLSDELFQVQGFKCPFGLENTSRALCEAVMAIDKEYFRTAVSNKIELKILKTVAEGDPICDTIYELKE